MIRQCLRVNLRKITLLYSFYEKAFVDGEINMVRAGQSCE